VLWLGLLQIYRGTRVDVRALVEQQMVIYGLFIYKCFTPCHNQPAIKIGNSRSPDIQQRAGFPIFAANFLSMNLHEYQAKEVLKRYNVPVQEGFA